MNPKATSSLFYSLEEDLSQFSNESTPIRLDDPRAFDLASEIVVEGRAILKPYHLVWGITMDPHAPTPNGLNIDTFGHDWPDFLLKFLKSDLDRVETEEELQSQLGVRQMPPLQVNSEELIPYFDLDNIPAEHHYIFNNYESLSIFSALAFMRTPMKKEVLQVLPEYLFSWNGTVPILQWIDFSAHPEVGPLQKHLISQIYYKHPTKMPSLVLTSANISKVTPESVSPETSLQFWNNGRGLRRKLMPLILFPSQGFYDRSVSSSYARIGSYPIMEFGLSGVVAHREGNIPKRVQELLFNGLGLVHPENLKMHNYPHITEDKIGPEVIDLLSSDSIPLKIKVLYLHFLSIGFNHESSLELALNNTPWSDYYL